MFTLVRLLAIRRFLIALLREIDTALLETHGWTPRGNTHALTDRVE